MNDNTWNCNKNLNNFIIYLPFLGLKTWAPETKIVLVMLMGAWCKNTCLGHILPSQTVWGKQKVDPGRIELKITAFILLAKGRREQN